MISPLSIYSFFFFFNDTATTEIYTLSLHDALPIYERLDRRRTDAGSRDPDLADGVARRELPHRDRKSTRLNSSHTVISYAVFCLKKKKQLSQGRSVHALRAQHVPVVQLGELFGREG